MSKTLVAIAAAGAILSLGSLVPAQAGGGATSAPSKYNNAGTSASVEQTRTRQHVHMRDVARGEREIGPVDDLADARLAEAPGLGIAVTLVLSP